MAGGYMGSVLEVNLSTRCSRVLPTDTWPLREYIGGSGLGARILYDNTDETTDPLGGDNLLIFALGPWVGTNVYSSDRFEVVAKSPLTGIYAESDCGGHFGGSLKRAGFDAVIVKGKASSPVYLWLNRGKVEIREAGHLWGLDTFETYDAVRLETHPRAEVASIGPAGEKLVKLAGIFTDGTHARAAARCGLGAVMGSKNLKAVAAYGDSKVPVASQDRLAEHLRAIAKPMTEQTVALRKWGTSNGLVMCEEIGDLPIRNWSLGKWPEGAQRICGQTMAKTILKGNYACGRCAIACGRVVGMYGKVYSPSETAGPEYETLGLLGSNCLVDDLDAISKANELCNRYGLDTISVGSAIAFAIEAYERGIIGLGDTGGIKLRWGDGEVLVEMVRQIGERTGIGRLLGEGTRNAAEALGHNSIEFAIQVKGLDLPAHDPRAKFSTALAYATSNRGACHLQAFSYEFENGISMPEIGIPVTLERHTPEGKAHLVYVTQNLMSILDSLKCCKFVIFGGMNVNRMVDILNDVTGWDVTLQEFMKTGERIFNLKRLYNTRLGVSRKDDRIPDRILTLMRDGGASGKLPPLGLMLGEYYSLRGWDEFGIPTDAKLEELGLTK